ncbi:VOC family protein [Lipingzhangella sp. LS1_29]|uniref:VOC family protein n=1 Tax=Lipingzhangella rawalii TaxID=2055835 RepID=A0ABU2H1D6_9ACTN|nr:VOC family protein [Lipingzhangella rawalii]MDS1268802.1 VOC family protein [Lipingzhangella rawalii]
MHSEQQRPDAVGDVAGGPSDPPALDHLVYAAPDGEAAVTDFAERTGVQPVPGGAHPGWGTRNWLVGLGPGTYLEIVGPDPDQEPPHGQRPFLVDTVPTPGVVHWCVRTPDIVSTVATARAAGYDPGPVREMSRRRPDGSLLQWSLTDPRSAQPGGLVPFLIDWGDTRHPSEDLEPQATVEHLHLSAPDPAPAQRALRALGISEQVDTGALGMTVTLRTPGGPVVLEPAERP